MNSFLECGIAGSYSSSGFNFLRSLRNYSMVAVPIYIPDNSGLIYYNQ